jgi:hypothetical protein
MRSDLFRQLEITEQMLVSVQRSKCVFDFVLKRRFKLSREQSTCRYRAYSLPLLHVTMCPHHSHSLLPWQCTGRPTEISQLRTVCSLCYRVVVNVSLSADSSTSVETLSVENYSQLLPRRTKLIYIYIYIYIVLLGKSLAEHVT